MSTAYQTLEPAHLQFDNDNTPYSVSYGDVYHPTAGAMGQARHVFLGGCGMPEAWRKRDEHVVLETGFGLGHNFLAVWEAWRSDSQRSHRLHFISVEKHPFLARDLEAAHAQSGAPTDLSAKLCANWPLPLPGFHRMHFDGDRVTLTVLFGDAATMLGELQTQVDAIFLDGFAPGKNPDMWSPTVLRLLATMSHSGTHIATWSVSGYVRASLAQAGFLTDKQPGYGGKREMLRGMASTAVQRRQPQKDRRALVIGAGLAGTSIAERLAARDWQVQIIEAGRHPAQGASGNIAGAFRPLPAADDGRLFRLTRAGFLYGSRHLHALREEELGVRWSPCGLLHLARNAEHEAKQHNIVRTLRTPESFLRYVTREEASKIAGHTTAFGGWFFPKGGWVNPPSLCLANLARHPGRITGNYGQHVARLQKVAGVWRAVGDQGEVIAEAPVVILANAADAARLGLATWLPLRSARGQVSHLIAGAATGLKVVVCGSGYATPPIDGITSVGATFFADDASTHLRLGDHLENLDRLDRMLPGFARNYPTENLSGRVSQRPMSLDRIPMVGELPSQVSTKGHDATTLPRHPGLHVMTGFGARGLVWCSLLGEHLASQINGDASPLAHSLAERIDPARFLFRRIRATPPAET